MREVWIWQRIVSPHMAGLAASLAEHGCRVTYVAEQHLSPDRVALGWQVPSLGMARLQIASTADAVAELVREASTASIHVCQGIRANGHVGTAQRLLARRGLRQWVVMETVDDSGNAGPAKRWLYSLLFRSRRSWIEGVLATGHSTARWIVGRGAPGDRVFPFAYFLPDVAARPSCSGAADGCFRFVYVGQLIELKRVGLLIAALSRLEAREFKLDVVGVGPLESELRALAERLLPGRVKWHGRLPSTEVPGVVGRADCLVLPSRHDGWGAVVSEAIMVGTPAICSDHCGSAGVVRASRVGGVFRSGDIAGLSDLLLQALDGGRVDDRHRQTTSSWGRCLGAEAGAQYLLDILDYCDRGGVKPLAPWDDLEPHAHVGLLTDIRS